MIKSWKSAFTKVSSLSGKAPYKKPSKPIRSLNELKEYLDWVHIQHCLLKPYFEQNKYPLVESRELLPSFETDLYEYKNLPGFSFIAFERPIDYFQEVFQFDLLHSCQDPGIGSSQSCPLEDSIIFNNIHVFQSRLPRKSQQEFRKEFQDSLISEVDLYPHILSYLLQMDRAHVMAINSEGEYYLSGIYGSFPSDLDTEIKRFGLKIGKFEIKDNVKYELNRPFVYQFLMELYGFPIASERRTSAALFARRLYRMGDKFMIRVLGQSDRTITTLYSSPSSKSYPIVEKIALVRTDTEQREVIAPLRRNGFFVDENNRVLIIRIIYKQHDYDPNNVREDRALSILRQEVIHPVTGATMDNFNIIKDTSFMTLKLNDIIRGEYTGRIKFKRNEIVENTETHEKRLKFLHAWLAKHQRRIIGYSDEFYGNVVKVLDNYLLNADNFEEFNSMHDLYQEVWANYSYIQQARKVKELEDLEDRNYKGEKISVLEMLETTTEIMSNLRFEIVNYFDELVERYIKICEIMLNDNYIQRKYVRPPKDELSEYGQKVRVLYGRLVALVDEFKAIRKTKVDQGNVQTQPVGNAA